MQAQRAATQAAADLATAKAKVTSTQQAVAAAGDVVISYQTKLDAFANASFRGANTSQLSVMLTAQSADDFLDESTVMNRVAQDTQKTLDGAMAAKNAAAKAKTDADAAESAATAAKIGADRASTAAGAAIVTAQTNKAELDTAVANYKNLYNKLSAQEKAAAAAAAEKAREESMAAAAAAAARAEADAADARAQADASAQANAAAASSSASSRLAAAAVQAGDTTPAGPTSTSIAAPAATSAGDPAPAPSTQSSAPAAPSSQVAAASSQGGDSAGAIAAAAARTKIGFAYTYAGDGPDAYDCSGLTTWAWAQAGISIPRASYEQANFPEVPLDQLQPGDLVTYYSPVSHVAIYVGDGMVVSAADESLGIIYVPVERAGPDATGHRVPRG